MRGFNLSDHRPIRYKSPQLHTVENMLTQPVNNYGGNQIRADAYLSEILRATVLCLSTESTEISIVLKIKQVNYFGNRQVADYIYSIKSTVGFLITTVVFSTFTVFFTYSHAEWHAHADSFKYLSSKYCQ
jgi:hypothetical protein